MERKNVSLNKSHLKTIEPLIKQHEGNLSAAMRDIIEFIGLALGNSGNLEQAKDILCSRGNNDVQYINRIYGITVPLTLFKWLLDNCHGIPPIEEAFQLFSVPDTGICNDPEKLKKIVEKHNKTLKWPISLDAHANNGSLTVQISGPDTTINQLEAILISIYLANISPSYEITTLSRLPLWIQVEYTLSDKERAVEKIKNLFL